MLKIIELFAGIGSQTQALKNIGVEHEVVAISEIDKKAVNAYEALHGKANNLGDITKIDELPKADLWTYSFPCQDLSLNGNLKGCAKGSGTRSGLLWEVERLLDTAKENGTLPKFLLLENVKNLLSERNYGDFCLWIQKLDKLGYQSYTKVLNAKDYGVPQNRERVFVVSILDGTGFQFPSPVQLERTLSDLLEHDASDIYYLSEEKYEENKIELKDGFFIAYEATIKGYSEAFVGDTINTERPTSETRRGRVGHGIANTLTTKQKQVVVVNNDGKLELRFLTPLECWRLMGFTSDQFNAARGTYADISLYQLAGNSIVVSVLEAIFTKMFLDTELDNYQYNIFELLNVEKEVKQ